MGLFSADLQLVFVICSIDKNENDAWVKRRLRKTDRSDESDILQ